MPSPSSSFWGETGWSTFSGTLAGVQVRDLRIPRGNSLRDSHHFSPRLSDHLRGLQRTGQHPGRFGPGSGGQAPDGSFHGDSPLDHSRHPHRHPDGLHDQPERLRRSGPAGGRNIGSGGRIGDSDSRGPGLGNGNDVERNSPDPFLFPFLLSELVSFQTVLCDHHRSAGPYGDSQNPLEDQRAGVWLLPLPIGDHSGHLYRNPPRRIFQGLGGRQLFHPESLPTRFHQHPPVDHQQPGPLRPSGLFWLRSLDS